MIFKHKVRQKLSYNALSLGDVAKKYTKLLKLLPVRKAQTKL